MASDMQHDGVRFGDVLEFWFSPPDSRFRGRPRSEWFRKNSAFDEQIRARFLDCHLAAAGGRFDAWAATPYGSLALVIVLDQFPRNLFRDGARAFASDARALAVARSLLERHFDQVLRPLERVFAYLPFEHCEDLAVQRRSLALFESLRPYADCASAIDYAKRHYAVVARFGRFPHRNAALGRVSTAEESEFLRRPGSGF